MVDAAAVSVMRSVVQSSTMSATHQRETQTGVADAKIVSKECLLKRSDESVVEEGMIWRKLSPADSEDSARLHYRNHNPLSPTHSN